MKMNQQDLIPAESGHIGTDESGKGDYFGPLVIAGFYCPEGQENVLRELGVRDSKTISDKRCRDIAETLQRGYLHAVVAIGPARYNELYEKFRNLNKLLAWGHARVIENILERVDCRQVVTDQFGDERFVRTALLTRGKTVTLVQRTKAESDPAVAAASILARAEFLKRLSFEGRDWGMVFPKGASAAVDAAAVEFVRLHGRESLGKVAKIHFKTTLKALGP
jgi:ribonuclease HIII